MKTLVRDRAYLDWLHTQRCVISGQFGNDNETVDPMHLGSLKGTKRGDNEVLPVQHHYHAEAHQSLGEAEMLRRYAPASLIIEAFRAYARQLYAEYKAR